MIVSINEVIVKSSDGAEKCLGDYKGQVLLIVNVASKCGFTKQYSGLQELQNRFGGENFQVLGFPCNDFGNQEPGSLEEIKSFCSTQYSVSFNLFEKVHAKGNTTEPFTTLNKTEPSGDVAWNFEKFLVGKDGSVISRYQSAVEPLSTELINDIKKALNI